MWNKVEDKLPKEWDRVLVYGHFSQVSSTYNHVMMGSWHSSYDENDVIVVYWTHASRDGDNIEVTHWMELPEPPSNNVNG